MVYSCVDVSRETDIRAQSPKSVSKNTIIVKFSMMEGGEKNLREFSFKPQSLLFSTLFYARTTEYMIKEVFDATPGIIITITCFTLAKLSLFSFPHLSGQGNTLLIIYRCPKRENVISNKAFVSTLKKSSTHPCTSYCVHTIHAGTYVTMK